MTESKKKTIANVVALIFGVCFCSVFSVEAQQSKKRQQPRVPPSPAKAAKRAAPQLETRFIIPFSVRSGSDTVGSITIAASVNPSVAILSTERPGDSIMFSLGLGGPGQEIATGEGSEIRFSGKHSLGDGELTVAEGSRVCLKKSQGEWVYVCGLGEYVAGGKTYRLGYNRTVDSCLTLLAKDDTILREGVARDLGRLTKPADVSRVVPKLVALLKDSSPVLRRGAAEGLGLIGSQDAFAALKQALATETDELTGKYLEEALAICGGIALVGDPLAAKMTDDEAADLFLGKSHSDKKAKTSKGGWKVEMLAPRIKLREADAMKTLTDKVASPATKVSEAASTLQAQLKKAESKSP
ncbi:MAG: HEAT repeat domain-containing protein [Blastocatellia bacterium]